MHVFKVVGQIDVGNSKFRQCSRIGHLLQSAQFRFTLSHEQGTRREWSSGAVSSQCLLGGTLRDWPDRKVARVAGSSSPHYEQRFRAPERPFSMETSRSPNHGREHVIGKQDRYILVLDKFFRVRLERQWRRDYRGRSFHSEASLEQEMVPGTASSAGLIFFDHIERCHNSRQQGD